MSAAACVTRVIVRPDPAVWREVPSADADHRWTWAVVEDLLDARPHADPVALHAQVDAARQAGEQLGDGDALYLCTGLATGTLLVASLAVRTAAPGRSDYLLDVADARRPGVLDAPRIDYLPAELADGITVLRYDPGADGIVGSRVIARRTAGLDVVIAVRSTDLAGIALVDGPMLELLASVEPVCSEGAA